MKGSACCKVRLYRPFAAAALARGNACQRPRDRRPRSHERARFASASRCISTSSRRSARHVNGMPHVIGGRYGLSSKEFTPAWWLASSMNWRETGRTGSSPSASPMTSAEPACRGTRRWTSSHQAPSGRCSRPGHRWHGRREQELHQDHRRRHRSSTLRDISFTTRRSPGRDDRVPSAVRPAADPIAVSGSAGQFRRLPSVRVAGADRRARNAPHRGQRFCSTARTRPTRGVGRSCRARCSSRSSTSGIEVLRHRRVPAWLARPAWPGRINTVHANMLLRHLGVLPREEAIAEIKAGDQQDVRQTRRPKSSKQQLRRRR